ncbi:response regulator [Carboxylicivirga caseinilyticus]|uniref:response regulator n=1 Tax=Carboxylicivirga caseinilyticus TaxID=3417572 RepID=UPI003D32DC7B|nr:response regulator [Marinilabiliaceae bacterium A049]
MDVRRKILYVDDEEINLLLFESNFKSLYNVIIAHDGFEGLKVLEDNPDTLVIISDMKMPGMNGIEFIKKAKTKYPDKKYYILTGFEITDEIKKAMESGLILEYFSKPFEVKRMHNIIKEAFEN